MKHDLHHHLLPYSSNFNPFATTDSTHLELTPDGDQVILHIHQVRERTTLNHHPAVIYTAVHSLLPHLREHALRDNERCGPFLKTHRHPTPTTPEVIAALLHFALEEFSNRDTQTACGVSLRVEPCLDSRKVTELHLLTPLGSFTTCTPRPLALIQNYLELLSPAPPPLHPTARHTRPHP